MRPLRLALPLLCGAALAACGSSSTTPANPVPSPVAVATPTAEPSPVLLAGCNLAPLPDLMKECPVLEPVYGQAVDDAIMRTFSDHPELFDMNDRKGGGVHSYKVLDHRKYTGQVVTNLQAQGYCARDELEEIQVKKTQDFNEQYNIWTWDGYVHLGRGAYVTTCFPAHF